jgi:hypothetical protein
MGGGERGERGGEWGKGLRCVAIMVVESMVRAKLSVKPREIKQSRLADPYRKTIERDKNKKNKRTKDNKNIM